MDISPSFGPNTQTVKQEVNQEIMHLVPTSPPQVKSELITQPFYPHTLPEFPIQGNPYDSYSWAQRVGSEHYGYQCDQYGHFLGHRWDMYYPYKF